MLTIVNIIDTIPTGKVYDRGGRVVPIRPMTDPTGLAVHHTKGRGNPSSLAEYKVSQGEHGHAYHFHDHRDRIYQTRLMDEQTWHAGAHNGFRWGICRTGDYDAGPWPEAALDRIADLTALISIWCGWWDPHQLIEALDSHGRDITAPRIAGHRELPWSSKKVNRRGEVQKGCPGYAQDCDQLRDRVLRYLMPRRLWSQSDAAQALADAGVVLPAGETP